jgi:hypothetical protein
MPLPLIYVVPGLLAAGAAAWEWLRPENDPAWADNNVFNDRMRQLHSHILDLNSAFAACKRFMSNKQQVAAWRNFKSNWSNWYKDTGRLYFDPNDAEISNAKLYTTQLAKWVDILKDFPECHGIAITPPKDTPPGAKPSTDWLTPVAWIAGGWLLSRALQNFLSSYRRR